MAELINPLSGAKSIVPELMPKRGRPAKNAPVCGAGVMEENILDSRFR